MVFMWIFAIIAAVPTTGLSVLMVGGLQYWLYLNEKKKSREDEERSHAERMRREELALYKFNDSLGNVERVNQHLQTMIAVRSREYGEGTYPELSDISLKIRHLKRMHAVQDYLPFEKNRKAFRSNWELGLPAVMGRYVDDLRYSPDSGWLRAADVVWYFSQDGDAIAFWVDLTERSNDESADPLSTTMIQGWSLFGFFTALGDAVALKSDYSVYGSNRNAREVLVRLRSDEIRVPQSVISSFRKFQTRSSS